MNKRLRQEIDRAKGNWIGNGWWNMLDCQNLREGRLC